MAFKCPFQPKLSCDSMNITFSALLEDVAASVHQWSYNFAQTLPVSAWPLSLTTPAAHLESSCKGFCAAMGLSSCPTTCISRWFPKFPNSFSPFLPSLLFPCHLPLPIQYQEALHRLLMFPSLCMCWILCSVLCLHEATKAQRRILDLLKNPL